LAGHCLILLRDDDATARFEPFDLLRAALRSRVGQLHAAAGRNTGFLIVEHHQRLAAQCDVALGYAHIPGKGRLLFLVAHFKRGRFDMHRLIAVLREALQRVRGTLRLLLLRLRPGHQKRERDGGAGVRNHFHCAPALLRSSSMSTLPSKRTSSPEFVISSRSALSVPCSIFTCTGCSDSTVPFRISTI